MDFRNAVLSIGGVALLASTLGCGTLHERRHMVKGNHLFNAKQYEQALREYEGALEVDPEAWEAAFLAATCYLKLYEPGSTDEKNASYAEGAIAALERCRKIEAPDAAARDKVENLYIGLLLAQGDSTTAMTLLEQQLAADPTNAGVVQRLANLHAKLGDFATSLRYFQQYAELVPDNTKAWHDIGVLCWDRSYRGGPTVSMQEREQVVAQGLEALDRALAIKPDSFDSLIYYNLLLRERAKVHAAWGRNPDAARDTAKANEILKQAQALKKKPGTARG